MIFCLSTVWNKTLFSSQISCYVSNKKEKNAWYCFFLCGPHHDVFHHGTFHTCRPYPKCTCVFVRIFRNFKIWVMSFSNFESHGAQAPLPISSPPYIHRYWLDGIVINLTFFMEQGKCVSCLVVLLPTERWLTDMCVCMAEGSISLECFFK